MKTIAPCPSAEDLRLLMLGRMPAPETERLAGHIEACNLCVEQVRQIQSADTLVTALHESPTVINEIPASEFITQLTARIRLLAAWHGAQTAPPETPGGSSFTAASSEVDHEQFDFLAPPQNPDEIGRLGTYRVLRVLGAGGMGVVFLAEDPHLERKVALKAMKPALAASESAKKRFVREARAMAAIDNDHIVHVYQVGEDRGMPFLAMQHLQGQTLEDRLQREGSLPLAEALRIARETAQGLDAADKRGLIHRDIKPANVWIEAERGRVKILDFGLARAPNDQSALTLAGTLAGTPAYMAPEQVAGEPVDRRCDLFSLGCMLYRMGSGQLPFQGPTSASILMSVMNAEPRPLRELNPAVPQSLAELVAGLLAKRRDDRPRSAREVMEALAGIERELELRQVGATNVALDGPAVMKSEDAPQALPRSPALPRHKSRPRHSLTVVAAAGLLLVGLLAAVVYRIQTDYGTLIVEIQDEQVEAKLKKEGLVVEDSANRRRFTITKQGQQRESTGTFRPAGDQGLKLQVLDDSGLELATNEFKLTRGDKIRVRVTLEPAGQPAGTNSPGTGRSRTTNDRKVAEAMVKFGPVAVRVAGRLRPTIAKDGALPAEDFELEEIVLEPGDRLTDSDLEIVHGLPSLRAVKVLGAPRVTEAGIAHLRDLPKLEVLALQSTQLTDEGLATIEAYRGLKELSLGGTKVSDAGLARLGKLNELGSLNVGQTQVTDAGLVHLKSLPGLRGLSLNDNKLKDAGLADLKALSRLRNLTLSNTAVTSAGLAHLADLTELDHLLLNNTQVTDEGLAHLRKLVRLRQLWLHDTVVTDTGLAALAQLTNLEDLNLCRTRGVTDSGLEKLNGLSALRSLNLVGTQVSVGGVQRLHEALPKCEVISDHGTFGPSKPDRTGAEGNRAQ